jgi:hypothetical protein
MIGDEVEPVAAFSNPTKLFKDVEDLVWLHDISWLDAVVLHAEQNGVEVEAVAGLINRNANLKALIAKDAEDLNFLPKTIRIPGIE